jgi:cytochrome bd-type quinol oxidase subunit 1
MAPRETEETPREVGSTPSTTHGWLYSASIQPSSAANQGKGRLQSARCDQKMKIAAIEAMWDTQPPPASFTVFGIPEIDQRVTRYKIELPWLLGLIATRSWDRPVEGINDLVRAGAGRIQSGLVANRALQVLRQTPLDAASRADFEAHAEDLGYASVAV